MEHLPTVILYHEISDKESPLLNDYDINISPSLFERQMAWMLEVFNPIRPADFLNGLDTSREMSQNFFVTFDDGYRSALKNAEPILTEKNIGSCWFINPAFIENERVFWLSKIMWLLERGLLDSFITDTDRRYPGLLWSLPASITPYDVDRWGKENYSRALVALLDEYLPTFGFDEYSEATMAGLYCSANELNAARSELLEIGNHTLSHVNSLNCSPEEFFFEVHEADRVLRSITGKGPLSFAFPFGEPEKHWTPKNVYILEQLGYRYIYTVENDCRIISTRLWQPPKNMHFLPRHTVPSGLDTKDKFMSWLQSISACSQRIG